MEPTKVLIMGAAGRDFHNFNTYFRDNESYEVVAFTATQIPDIEGRTYPKELAGKLYPKGIPIYDEKDLAEVIEKTKADVCVLSYSDLPYNYVMHIASKVMALGPNFWMMGKKKTSIKSTKPLISVCAVRTGCGKSQTTRKLAVTLSKMGLKVVAIRHPMPYDPDLNSQACQRYGTLEDLDKYRCTIEEREEYEPLIVNGIILYAGVDYERILREAEKEADIIIWDGGNNDFPFYKSDLEIVVTDPHRAGHEISYYPGEVNLRTADVVIINKMETADRAKIDIVRKNIAEYNPKAIVIDGASPLTVEGWEKIRGKKVLVVEDGPTLTHGEMEYGAGAIAAWKFGAKELVDPRPFAVGSIKATFEKYNLLGIILPAMGYGKKQIEELEKTINAIDCDLVVIGTPIDLTRIVNIKHDTVRVKYDLQEIGKPDLMDVIKPFLEEKGLLKK
ncbi:MAG TPA: cyclic 2,3-diphosphoglycerate synthase [candidate division Zixibacteria bacterium]|nr:cyclic 2,3-diphosphoglycerate synthase [candidate division Zixibacteria bacterium]